MIKNKLKIFHKKKCLLKNTHEYVKSGKQNVLFIQILIIRVQRIQYTCETKKYKIIKLLHSILKRYSLMKKIVSPIGAFFHFKMNFIFICASMSSFFFH